jgi:diaminohydroxyphosphoribosylaminopyrimidine deaminase/5-amino-6-(5-phosphoribosylamino)uracil reductase
MHEHDFFMNRCFELAEKGRGYTRSNPMVGALLVHKGKIISEGFHAYYGGPHAEVNCLNQLTNKDLIKNSTLYISLEPCNFQGKTPACTDLILNSGLTKVVIGSVDFNPRVRFQGMDYLRSQEIDVINLNWEERQKSLNIKFFINQTLQEPYFLGKLAFSGDHIIGKLGEKVKITNPEIDTWSHKLRSEVDAILVGKNTWENDQPSLNVRYYPADFQPDILVLQSQIIKPITRVDGRKVNFISEKDPIKIKQAIFNLGYKNVLVEGGAEVFRFFMDKELLHEIYTIENQGLSLESGIPCPSIPSEKYRLDSQKSYFRHQISHFTRYDLPSA